MKRPAPPVHSAPLVIHGWTIFAHPLFLDQLERLRQQVQALQKKDPLGYQQKNPSKRLAAITKLAFDIIPQDPTRPEYRQGHTFGDAHKHWLRAKFFQQYRLFFRFHSPSRVLVLACGRFNDASEVIHAGLRLLEQQELHALHDLNQLRAEIAEGLASGPSQPLEDVFARLA